MTRSGRSAWESLLLTFGYPLLAILIATTWLLFARTEVRTPPFANVQRMVRGESIKPWIYRRLVPDGGMLLSRLVPRKTWDELSDRIEHSPRLKTVVREHLGWPREQDPLLFSVSAMIAASALGFMWCTLWLIRRLYQVPAGVAHGTGMLLGIGLLGGRGSATFVWHQYPYDLPQAFLFLGCVCCVLAGSWLIIPSFLLAVYNKETSVLILPAILMLWPGDRRTRWGLTGVLTFLYAAVQFWIRWRFRYADAFSLTTSYYNVMNLVFGSWRLPLWLLAFVALARSWEQIPAPLRKLAYVPVVLLAAAMVLGWAYEYREYMEAYPFVALALLQVLAIETGWGHLFMAR